MSANFTARPEVQCAGKIGYDGPRGAHVARSRMKGRHQAARNVYQCPHCHLWHIGNPPATKHQRNTHR